MTLTYMAHGGSLHSSECF